MATNFPQDPFPNGKPNQDLLQNLSFVYQANIYLNGIGIGKTTPSLPYPGPGPSTTSSRTAGGKSNAPKKKRGKKSKASEAEGTEAAFDAVARRANRGYEYAARHSMLKTDPSIKRTFCGKCYTVLIPGITSQTRIKGGKKVSHRVVTTCLTCCNPSSILAPPHQLPQNLPSPIPERPLSNISPFDQEQIEDPTSSSSPQSSRPVKPIAPLDGPVRSKRRSRMVKPVPFWTKAEHTIIPLDQLGRIGSANATGGKDGKGNGGKKTEKVEGGQKQGKVDKGKMEMDGSKQPRVERQGNKDQRGRPTQDREATRLQKVTKSAKTISPSTAVSAEMDEEEMMNMC